MIGQTNNNVIIKGIVNKIEIFEEKTKKMPARDMIRGIIFILVEQEYEGAREVSEVPFKFIMCKHKVVNGKIGDQNKNWDSFYNIIKSIKSVAMADNPADASYVTITGARVAENSYYNVRAQRLFENWDLSGNFINVGRIPDEKVDQATFQINMMVKTTYPEVNKAEEETGRLIVEGIIGTFSGDVQKLKFVVENSKAIAAITNSWDEQTMVKAAGRIRFTSIEVARTNQNEDSEDGFGEDDIPNTYTQTRKELVITTGGLLSEEHSDYMDSDDVFKALQLRKARMDSMELDAQSAPAPAQANTTGRNDSSKASLDDF